MLSAMMTLAVKPSANYTVKLTSVDGTSRPDDFFLEGVIYSAGLARSSMARQLRELLCAIALADNSDVLASQRAADRGKSSASSHQRMSSVAMFTVRTTYWRSGPIIIYIYELDLTIKLVVYEPW